MSKYRVETNWLSDIDMGAVYEKSEHIDYYYSNNCKRLHKSIINRNPDWFEKIEPEVKGGQYWDWLEDVVRINRSTDYTVTVCSIRYGDKQEISIRQLKRESTSLSDKEVAKAIIEEAKRRYEGKAIESINDRGHVRLGIKHLHYEYEADTLWLGAYKIYEQGRWAEIIEDKWEVYQDDIGIYVTNGDKAIRAVNGFPVKSLSDIEAEAIATALNELDNESR